MAGKDFELSTECQPSTFVTKLKISLCGIGNPRMIVASSEVAKGAHAVPDVVELVLLRHLVMMVMVMMVIM